MDENRERRAVRGGPIDDGIESAELAELRRFEEEAFPRNGIVSPGRSDGTGAADAGGALLPGRWSGSGDVPSPENLPIAPRPASRANVLPPPDSDWLRSLKLPDLPIRWEPQVVRYLEFFKNESRGRAIMTGWLRRGGRYRSLIEANLERHGLPKDLFYVAMVESGFDTGARSRVGAGGIWQFMPGAARAYGLEVSFWVDARRDPERSAEAAARYLKDLYARFRSWPLAFAAYNAGYGAVLSSIGRYNTNDYWELCRHENGLPWESSLYVPKILAAAIVGRNLEAFGFTDVIPDAPFAYDRVDAAPGATFASVARVAGVKPEALAALNPHLVRDRAPPDRGPTAIRLPPGAGPVYAQAMERERNRQAAERTETITLRFGETLDDVARSRGTSARELRRLNGVKDSAELRAGETILVPRSKTPASPAPGGGREEGDGKTATADAAPPAGGEGNEGAGDTQVAASSGSATGRSDEDLIIVAVPDRSFSYDGRERVFYRTRDGDSLDELAEVFGVRIEDLVEWNNLDASAKLHPRMVLQVFVRKDFDASRVVLVDPARVRAVTLGSEEFLELETARRGKRRLVIEAKEGETLAKIGRRYGLTLGDLARINRFASSTDLKAGQRVVVYSPIGEPAREVARGRTPESRRSAPSEGPAPHEASARARRDAAAKGAVRASADRSERPGSGVADDADDAGGRSARGRALGSKASPASPPTAPPAARTPGGARAAGASSSGSKGPTRASPTKVSEVAAADRSRGRDGKDRAGSGKSLTQTVAPARASGGRTGATTSSSATATRSGAKKRP